MENNAVHLICILDRSGSMASLEKDVIGSFNNFLKEQQGEDGKAYLTLVLFDDSFEKVYDRVPLEEVKPIDSSIYFARGMTALYDAIGKTISEYNDKDAMVLIQTDGEENYSKEYNHKQIQSLIKKKENIGWDFIFLGANIDVEKSGSMIGLASNKTMAFDASSQGIQMAYNSMDQVSKAYRNSKLEEWKEDN